MNQGEFKKYQEYSEAFKEIIKHVTTSEIGQLKLYFVNLEKKINNREKGIYSEYSSLKNLLETFKEGKGKIALHFAVARGDLEIVKYMIDTLHIDPKLKDSENNNAFFTAVEHGHLDMVRWLVEENNFSINDVKDGQITPLHVACNQNHIDLVKYFLSSEKPKVDINKVSIYGTAMNWSVGNKDTRVMQLLLEHGADPNGDLTCPAPAPLILAIDFNNKEMFDLLLKHNADVKVKDPHGYSTLHVAAQKGILEFVEILVKKGVDVDYEVNGQSALFLAFKNHKFNVVNFLKQKSKNYENVEEKIKKLKLQEEKYEENKPKADQLKQVGNKFYSEQKYEEALEQYKKGLQFDRDNTIIHRNMAACYLALKQYEEALNECHRAKIDDPKNVKTLYREAQAYVGLNKLIDAASSFWECSTLEPNNPLFRNEFKKYVELAKKQHAESLAGSQQK